MAMSALFASESHQNLTQTKQTTIIQATYSRASTDFEKAVQLIKKYETLHQPRHWPLVGYGHKVLPGEKFSRTKALNEAEADALLRKDLLKNCAVFREFGADSLILGVLAYNIGSGATLRSSVAAKLKAGNRDIYASYIAHARYRGKIHSQIQRRRIEEYETLFIKDMDRYLHEEAENATIGPVAMRAIRDIPDDTSDKERKSLTLNIPAACILRKS